MNDLYTKTGGTLKAIEAIEDILKNKDVKIMKNSRIKNISFNSSKIDLVNIDTAGIEKNYF